MLVGRCLGAAENKCYRHKKWREITPRPTVKHKHIFQFKIGIDFFKQKNIIIYPKKKVWSVTSCRPTTFFLKEKTISFNTNQMS